MDVEWIPGHMDHHYIEQQNISDRYLLRKLPPEERARFEEHFFDCRECLDRLETTEDFRGALRAVAIEDAARSFSHAGLYARISRMVRIFRIVKINRLSGAWRLAALLAAIMLLAAFPAVLWIRERGRARDDQAQFRTISIELRRQYDESRQKAERLESELRQSAERRGQLEAQLDRERRERSRLVDELEKLKGSQSAAPVFILSLARSDGTGQPLNRIALPRSAKRISLSPELEPDPEMQAYRAILRTADSNRIWSQSNLRLDSKGALNLSFDTSLFKPGNYLLTLEGLTQQGTYAPAVKYPFQAIKE
jgi:Putative zinc-finger